MYDGTTVYYSDREFDSSEVCDDPPACQLARALHCAQHSRVYLGAAIHAAGLHDV
jgi:hypothetical protein